MASVLLIGSGGREHAIAWKLVQSERVRHVYVCPGNAGTEHLEKVSNIILDINNGELIDWCKTKDIKLVVVGPEDPLANGIADKLQHAGIKCFGPSGRAAQIEASKEFAKAFMDRHKVPTARWKSFNDVEEAKKHIFTSPYDALVIKASGLAAGKGVIVNSSRDDAIESVENLRKDKSLASASETIVVEELLKGEEISVLCFSDGTNISVMPASQDHKRLNDGDQGPNTGGMGAYCPCPQVSVEMLNNIKENILQKTINGMRAEGRPFVGVLYAGLMVTTSGPKVLEFNCRFGDPETQVILPILKSDLYSIMHSCVDGTLDHLPVKWHEDKFAVGVVLASGGYPGSYEKGKIIEGLDKIPSGKYEVFHAGTASQGDKIVTSGGRVLCVVSVGTYLAAAAHSAQHAASDIIHFDRAFYRTDIAHKAIIRASNNRGMTYEVCGVSIEAGNQLVEDIKATANLTLRSGAVGGLGGFGGIFDLKAAGYVDPYLVSGTDGVGTKLKIAQAINKHDTVGIDLVAMCVNDILTHGAEPLFFLDTFSCGKLHPQLTKSVIKGISDGCLQSGCMLIGGETAEMPSMYQGEDYDLTGFAVGAVEKSQLLPNISSIKQGDIVIGLQSSGVHSNGYSLVRKLVEVKDFSYNEPTPFDSTRSLGETLLTPTKIYVKSVLPLLRKNLVKAAAHITGGGLTENIPRILPLNLGVDLDGSKWILPRVFHWISREGHVDKTEMLKTFNCGLGMVLIVSSENQNEVLKLLEDTDEEAMVVGKVVAIQEGDPRVNVDNLYFHIPTIQKPKRKVGVLISGSGTNLQALIDHTQNRGNHSAAEIVLVLSNKDNVEGLNRARKAGIKTQVINFTKGTSREDYDMLLHVALLEAEVDIVCLAGFMRILSGQFVRLWTGKLLNVHPSLLPSFKGANAHKDVLEFGARVSGCSVHFVEEEVDAGAVILQAACNVDLDDTVDSLQEKIKKLEHKIFPQALELLARKKISRGDDAKLVYHNN